MIPYIDAQMAAWGRWAVRRASRALGYPQVSPMFRGARFASRGSTAQQGVAICDLSEIHDMDAAVQRLAPAERALAAEFYVVGGTGAEIAARLGIARQRLYEKIHLLHQAVMGHLHDVVLTERAALPAKNDLPGAASVGSRRGKR